MPSPDGITTEDQTIDEFNGPVEFSLFRNAIHHCNGNNADHYIIYSGVEGYVSNVSRIIRVVCSQNQIQFCD